MATVELRKTTLCQAPREVAFRYVADYRNVPQWLFGIHEFTPVDGLDYGLGATFDASVHLGVHLHSRIRVDDWVEGEMLSFDSVKGFKVNSLWRFVGVDEATTHIEADVTYSLPFGPAGKAMGKVMEPFVRTAVSHSSTALARHIEEYAAR